MTRVILSLPTAPEEFLGFATKKNKDWFDESNVEIQKMLEEKRSAQQVCLAHPFCPAKKPAFRQIRNMLQLKLRVMQNEWWTNLAIRTQRCADAGDFRGFYEALKAVYGPTYQTQSSLCSADRQTLLKDNSNLVPLDRTFPGPV